MINLLVVVKFKDDFVWFYFKVFIDYEISQVQTKCFYLLCLDLSKPTFQFAYLGNLSPLIQVVFVNTGLSLEVGLPTQGCQIKYSICQINFELHIKISNLQYKYAPNIMWGIFTLKNNSLSEIKSTQVFCVLIC